MIKLLKGCIAAHFLLLMFHVSLLQAGELNYPVIQLAEKVHVINGPLEMQNEQNRGFRNNVVIIQTSKGVVIFDPGGSANAGEMVINKVKALTNKPIVAVFNSHAHGDHWLGNEAIKHHFPQATIYGHKNTQTRIRGKDGQNWVERVNKATKGAGECKKAVAPDRVVNNNELVRIGDTHFRVYHPHKAHTDSDIMIEIVGKNIIFTGDVVRNGMLGRMNEGFKGNIKAIDLILSKKFKTIIPGHGLPGGQEIARRYHDYLQAIRKNVKQYYDEGLADYEMKDKILAKVSSYKDWANFKILVGPHINRAYLEVENEAF